jgi:hypothetical protein
MTPEQIAEVWEHLDREHLVRVARQGPEPVFATISGAHLYRVLLTGIHMMETGEVVANIAILNQRFAIAEIDELVARKRGGAEKMRLEERELAAHETLLDRLGAKLEAAFEASELPDEPRSAAALDEFVVRLRLAGAGAG